jgi:hypothetical protein
MATDKDNKRDLWRIAYRCCLARGKNNCSQQCERCALNISRFTTKKEADLIMTGAAIDACETIEQEKREAAETAGPVLAAILIILVPILMIRSCFAPGDRIPEQKDPNILKMCQYVEQVMYDINGDGQFNCIDYSLIFHRQWSGARIIRNVNPNTGMNHLFISIDGVCIEPQATTMKYTMREIWGYKYNAIYNVDETEYWERQAVTYGY